VPLVEEVQLPGGETDSEGEGAESPDDTGELSAEGDGHELLLTLGI
jgi:hypothetical protein